MVRGWSEDPSRWDSREAGYDRSKFMNRELSGPATLAMARIANLNFDERDVERFRAWLVGQTMVTGDRDILEFGEGWIQARRKEKAEDGR